MAHPFETHTAAERAVETNRERIRRHIATGGFYAFVKFFWPTVEPGVPFSDNWHIKLVCDHLEAVSRGEIEQLIINQPPGTSKSSIVSVMYPVWDWLEHHAGDRYMFATFDESLAVRDSEKSRNLVNSVMFRILFGDMCGHRPGTCHHKSVIHSRHDKSKDRSDTLGVWYTAAGGMRFSTTIQSKATGWHAHKQIVDDPLKPQDVLGGSSNDTRSALNRIITWFSGTMATRKADPKRFYRIIVMQRLHDGDLTGHLLRTQPGQWVHVNLPMEFIPEKAYRSRWGSDPRTVAGELLCPGRFDAAAVERLKRDMGPFLYAAQNQQEPIPPGGGIVQESWLAEHDYSSEDLERMGAVGVHSWDCSFKDLVSSDPVAGHTWYYLPSDDSFYLTEVINEQFNFVQTLGVIESLAKKHPSIATQLIEDKANGPAAMSVLQNKVGGMVPVTPKGSKEGRLIACTPALAAGRVKIRRAQPWTDRVRDEIIRFPRYMTDDNVDAMTQALGWFLQNGSASWLHYMGELFKYGQAA